MNRGRGSSVAGQSAAATALRSPPKLQGVLEMHDAVVAEMRVDHEIVLLPVVALSIVDLIPAALEDVEVRLVLVPVAEVRATGR